MMSPLRGRRRRPRAIHFSIIIAHFYPFDKTHFAKKSPEEPSGACDLAYIVEMLFMKSAQLRVVPVWPIAVMVKPDFPCSYSHAGRTTP